MRFKYLLELCQISPAVCFLLSPAASYITGATLKVDAGQSLYHSVWEIPGTPVLVRWLYKTWYYCFEIKNGCWLLLFEYISVSLCLSNQITQPGLQPQREKIQTYWEKSWTWPNPSCESEQNKPRLSNSCSSSQCGWTTNVCFFARNLTHLDCGLWGMFNEFHYHRTIEL